MYLNPDYFENRSNELQNDIFPVKHIKYDYNENPDLSIPWHSHDEVEFLFINKGNAYITCAEKTFEAHQGDLIFINQQVHHFITPFSDESLILDALIVHPCVLFGVGQLDLEQKYVLPILHSKNMEFLSLGPSHPLYEFYISHVKKINTAEDEKILGHELITKASLLLMWQKFLPLVNPSKKSDNKKLFLQDEQRVKEATSYIQEHYMEAITLDDIAGSILVSKSECCRCFKRSLHTSPFEYLMNYRILEAAKWMKRKPQESISQIAGSVGFNNTSYFNKIFKKYMSCTPSEYRQKIQK